MKTITSALFVSLLSINSHALTVSDADGWNLRKVSGDKMLSIVLPGAEYALVKDAKDVDGTTITIRKVDKQSQESLADRKENWMHAIFTAEKLKKIQTSPERQSTLQVDGQWRFVAELISDTGSKTPLNSAIMAFTSGEDLYLVMYEHKGLTYRAHRKEALDLLKKIKIDVSEKSE